MKTHFGCNELTYFGCNEVFFFSAHPHSLSIVSESKARYSDQYTLKWEVVSFPEISQYELLVQEVSI